ncbi:membrane protein [Cellvibrio zantedeschiae]|uniref:Membrane protein n=1 Tax=Cellvibrio zantedeschiae TaxID=1237077 RepID=A0ABQ3B579_9GAMM|nr:DUF883 family protein [Cellvibrio zantedeschiae]GGY77775.1 membrane protein [Cellvibrio zantedeschiae]
MNSDIQPVESFEPKEKPGSISVEFQRFLTDIEDLVAQATSLTGEDLAKLKNTMNERIVVAKASLNELSNNLVQKARNGAAATNNYVHEQPWTAVGAGAAIGLLVGLLVSRRD